MLREWLCCDFRHDHKTLGCGLLINLSIVTCSSCTSINFNPVEPEKKSTLNLILPEHTAPYLDEDFASTYPNLLYFIGPVFIAKKQVLQGFRGNFFLTESLTCLKSYKQDCNYQQWQSGQQSAPSYIFLKAYSKYYS